MKAKDVYSFLCTLAPLDLQADFDNSGFQVGHMDAEVYTVLVSLDITNKVINEAGELGAELIVSHHPLIFNKAKSVSDTCVEYSRVLRLAEKKIAAVSMHTNLDMAEGGVNDALLELFNLKSEQSLDGYGRIGSYAQPYVLSDFLILCKNVLHAKGLRYYDAGKPVKRLAVMGGAGGGSVAEAAALGCDTYLTADIKHSQFIEASELGINLIDGGHFYTENPVVSVLADKLKQHFPALRVFKSSALDFLPEFY